MRHCSSSSTEKKEGESARVLVREGDGEVVDVGLGRAVDAEERSGNAARERRQVDDRALAAVDRRKKKVRLSNSVRLE